eukprot:SAG22_NODE_407_length_10957_cov_5.081691_4_plen_453_part_00
MPGLAITAEQQRELDTNGFTVMESFFKGPELDALVAGVEAVAFRSWGVTTAAEADASKPPVFALERAADPRAAAGGERGGGGDRLPNAPSQREPGMAALQEGGVDEIFLNLLTHERVLPYVVDSLGWNIHLRDALFTPQKPFGGRGDGAGASDPARLSAAWHFDQEEELSGVTQDGLLPLVDYKVSVYLSDHTEPGHACTMLVPGSHRWTPEQRSTWEDWLEPADVVPLRVPIGTVLLWRSSLLHAVSPHLSASPRYHLYFSFVPRWVRPSFRGVFSTAAFPDPAGNAGLLERCSPIQRQLLGAMGDLTPPASSLYWFPQSEAQVPLKRWYEARALSVRNQRTEAVQRSAHCRLTATMQDSTLLIPPLPSLFVLPTEYRRCPPMPLLLTSSRMAMRPTRTTVASWGTGWDSAGCLRGCPGCRWTSACRQQRSCGPGTRRSTPACEKGAATAT